jgi:ferric-dicitrate binding protein FerR (iron transport regulator)
MNIHKHGKSGDESNSHSDDFENQIEHYRKAEKEKVALSDSEVEQALDNILQEIETPGENNKESPRINWKLYSIAASIVFLLVVTFFSIPKSIQVPNGEVTSITLPDGSAITLNSGSELKYSRLFNYTGRDVELYGEGYFQIVSQADNLFTVTTQNSQVKVLGTEFNLTDWNQRNGIISKVTVTEGKVEYLNKTNAGSFILEENDEAMIDQNFELIQQSADLKNSIAWLSNNISFQNEPLVLAFEKLERRFEITIEYERRISKEDNSISAFYNEPNDAESIIQDICTIKGLSYQKTHNGFKVLSE